MNTLKKLRKDKGFTQQKLAEMCGVVRNTISMIEMGANKPSVPLAKKLGEALGVDWTVFFAD